MLSRNALRRLCCYLCAGVTGFSGSAGFSGDSGLAGGVGLSGMSAEGADDASQVGDFIILPCYFFFQFFVLVA